MTIIDSDHAVQFTVQPPRLTDDLAMIEHTKRGVAQCTPDQRYALIWALASYDDAAQRVMVEQRIAPPVAPLPVRRQVGLLEAIRGVECCDPAVTAQWQRWRICFYVVAVIFCVVTIFGLLFGEIGVIIGIGVASIWSMLMSFGMTRGKASVCH